MAKNKGPGGRPTKYKPIYCEYVIWMMACGCSKIEVCAEIGICYDTFLDWQKEHEEFSESVKRGSYLSEAWWEREGREALRDKDFSYTGWYMNMKNRFKWSDKVETDNTHKGDIKIEVEFVDAKD